MDASPLPGPHTPSPRDASPASDPPAPSAPAAPGTPPSGTTASTPPRTAPPPPSDAVEPPEIDPAAVTAWEALFRAQVAIVRRLGRPHEWPEASMREYDVLFNLATGPAPMRLSELNRRILLSQPSLSRMVERLETAGLVDRRRDPRDGRGTLVSLTPEGRRVQRRLGRRHAVAITRAMSVLDRADLALLTDLCTRLGRAEGTGPSGRETP